MNRRLKSIWRKNKANLFIIALILGLSYSCVKFEPVSPVPEISYSDLNFYNAFDSALGIPLKLGYLEFNFVDGDADFGSYLDLPDSVFEGYNFFRNNYIKKGGIYIQEDIDSILTAARIRHDPKLDRVGQNKTVKGLIKLRIILDKQPDYDSVKYEFYIVDRAQNKSNIASTPDFSMDSVWADFEEYKESLGL